MRFLRLPESSCGVFHREFRLLVPRFMILFAVMNRRRAMCMRSQFMKFGRSLVGIVWHSSLHNTGRKSLQRLEEEAVAATTSTT
jgi:hypothetical protein